MRTQACMCDEVGKLLLDRSLYVLHGSTEYTEDARQSTQLTCVQSVSDDPHCLLVEVPSGHKESHVVVIRPGGPQYRVRGCGENQEKQIYSLIRSESAGPK